VGNRQEKRSGERIGIALGKLIAPLMTGSWRKYRPIQASTVALAMIRAPQLEAPGVHIYEFDSIRELATD
jgi:hypothetical protein